jgi:hypothetical protein
MQCGISADSHFGPRVLPCRRDFDFTLLFEQAILALAPDLLFLVLCFLRWFHIRREPKEVRRGATGTWKMVGLPSAFLAPKLLEANVILKSHAGAFHSAVDTEACPPRFVVFAALSKNKDLGSVCCSRADQHSGVATAITL